ncbi:MAG TPA: hypothetical protein VJO35_15030 [Terriglobales bacterium]|nr:hypothetical protein [Terriglobales bacterium]
MARFFWLTALAVISTALAVTAQAGLPGNDGTPPANPGRPTVSTPAMLTPAGYLQFETGFLTAWQSPEFSSQTNLNEVIKFAVSRRLELLAGSEPFAHSRVAGDGSNAAGGVTIGAQAAVYQGEGVKPTIALSYFRSIYGGNAADLDIGSYKNSALLLASADVSKFHYDFNLFFNEQEALPVRRGQLGQSLSVSRPLTSKFGVSGEIWHFTQPFLRGNAIGNLWALSYTASKLLVFDAGFDHGFTRTSTHWEVFSGFTYLLPHKIFRW